MTNQTRAVLLALAGTALAVNCVIFLGVPWFRQHRLETRRTACTNNLRLIDHAKDSVGILLAPCTGSYTPQMSELQPLFKGDGLPICREGGVYSINAFTSFPTCFLSGPPFNHRLDPRTYIPKGRTTPLPPDPRFRRMTGFRPDIALSWLPQAPATSLTLPEV